MSCCILKEDSQFVVYNKGAGEYMYRYLVDTIYSETPLQDDMLS
jgi:hypothetical protein